MRGSIRAAWEGGEKSGEIQQLFLVGALKSLAKFFAKRFGFGRFGAVFLRE
jgi:hypothetical protein